ncbi:TonB-dependent receptor [Sphingomonas sp. BK580]|uniref:TonB-dependent receptor n=1 Tax=Sphingomonas sp. BK580 TaxID=2586972 RepID=UPI00161D4663|nr:TonB-dependent receptor [Sphingomonas sp. BK580]MBB3694647.1 outer membrane receptor protein involved in Fe transport [Sphingomonas sp. BK580]
MAGTATVTLFAQTAAAQSTAPETSQASIEASKQAGSPGTDTADPNSADIVVTATRRSESVQNVPLSITAVTSESLERKAATNFFDYGSSIPNLSFGNTAEGTTGARTIAIRGISDRNTTGFYIDETPVAESLDPRIIDVNRIEVLRGPQGTLYGARSMGGTVRLITIQPDVDRLAGRVHGSLSTTDGTDKANYSLDGAINIPVVAERIGLRIVGVREYNAGYFKRVVGPTAGQTTTIDNVGDSKVNGVSAALLFKITDNFSVTPRVLYQQTSVNGFPFADVAVTNGSAPTILRPDALLQRRLFNVPEFSRDKWLLATYDMKLSTGIGTFTSSTSYFRRRSRDVEDQTDFIASPGAFGIAPVPTSIEIDSRTNAFTQELRFASDLRGPFQIVTGVFFNRTSSNRSFPPNIISGLDALFNGAFGTDLVYQTQTPIVQKDYAAYAEGTLEVVSGLKAIVGARVFKVETTSETMSDGIAVGGPTTIPRQTIKEDGIQPKFSLQYQIAPGNQVYAVAAKGFRPGGVNGVIPTALGCAANLQALGLSPSDAAFYGSDSVWSYEAGAKTTLLDRKVTANISGFRIDWDDIQQRIQLQCGFGFRGNAGKARSQGLELELTARPFSGLSLTGGLGYTDARFTTTTPGTKFTKGDRVPQVPRYTLNLGADYTAPITANLNGFAHADFSYVSDSISALNANTDASGRLIPRIRPSYSIVNLRGGVAFGNQEVAVFVKNVADERASLGDALAVAAEAPNRARVSINQPRTIGIELRRRF